MYAQETLSQPPVRVPSVGLPRPSGHPWYLVLYPGLNYFWSFNLVLQIQKNWDIIIIKADSQNRLRDYGSGSLGRRVRVNQVHVEPWISELMDTELSLDVNVIRALYQKDTVRVRQLVKKYLHFRHEQTGTTKQQEVRQHPLWSSGEVYVTCSETNTDC
jgi:hypothetical protein